MSSKKKSKKAQSNRQNAQKSTGPKTEEGKAKSSQNAVKHGLYAETIVIESPQLKENKQAYIDLIDSLFNDLEPEGLLQEDLVYKIAECIWRRRRVIAAETAKIREQLDYIDPALIRGYEKRMGRYDLDDPEDVKRLEEKVANEVRNEVGKRSIPRDDYAMLYQRYEMRLDRQMTRAFKLLRELKQMAVEKAARKRADEEIRRAQTLVDSRRGVSREPDRGVGCRISPRCG